MMSTEEVAVMTDVPDEVQRWTAKRNTGGRGEHAADDRLADLVDVAATVPATATPSVVRPPPAGVVPPAT